ncbi:MAG: hypothetical protein L0H93_20405 [Nocardioides sp.]|nr:hypothetical protein [Nocardioides sp.]
MTEYRIEFSIQRCEGEDEDWREIGFGSSGAWPTLDACTHWIDSGITHGEWETSGGMPAPRGGHAGDRTGQAVTTRYVRIPVDSTRGGDSDRATRDWRGPGASAPQAAHASGAAQRRGISRTTLDRILREER